MKFIILFSWVLVPLGLWLGYERYGTPHVIGTYTYAGSTYRPASDRYRTGCTYYGWEGRITTSAVHGRCPWVRFFKPAA